MKCSREYTPSFDKKYLISILTPFRFLLLLLLAPAIASQEVSVKFALGDETPASFFIGNIVKQTARSDFRLGAPSTILSASKSPKMRATLLDTTRGLASKLLHLSDMGDLYTINTIDRDDVLNVCGPLECCSQPQCNLTFTAVFVQNDNSGQPFKVAVNVQLIDMNDNPPTFQSDSFSITIPETTSLDFAKSQSTANMEYSLPRASDKDSSVNGVKIYQLENQVDFFSLTAPESDCYPCLRVSSSLPLDYENPKHRKFVLTLLAIDGGATPKSGSITINIFLTDLNDNAPAFAQSTEVVRVLENHTYNQAIYTARATDADSDANGRVKYSFKNVHSDGEFTSFIINSDTGEIFLQSALDYEKFSERKIVLEILAIDDGRPALTSSFSLSVLVSDTNDNPPEIQVQQNYTVMENRKSGIPVLQLLISDADDVSQGKVECHIENQAKLPLRLEGQTFLTIWTTKQLDYEKTPFINFNLVCQDKAEPRHNITTPLTVVVGNENDNAPIFYSAQKMPTSFVELSLKEDVTILQPVYLPSVVDNDGNAVTFTLRCHENGCPFTLKTDTGAIYLKEPLDYERVKNHEMEILAVDSPADSSNQISLTSTLKVRVNVRDVNDNAPELRSPYIIPVKHNTAIGSLVSQLIFKDSDQDGLQEVTTKLVAQESYPVPLKEKYFTLKENGALTTVSRLDREKLSVIALTVVATDIDSIVRLSSTVTIAVVIESPSNNETLKIVRPFPGSVLLLPVGKFPGRHYKPDSVRRISIPIDVYDRSNNSELNFFIDPKCNGSEFFSLERNRTAIIKLISTDSVLTKLANLQPSGKLELSVKVVDRKDPKRTTDSTFYVELDCATGMSANALWPADAADAGVDMNQGDIPRDDTWGETVDSSSLGDGGGGSGTRPFKLSLGHIVMFLLILVFSLAVGFAMFAAILWTRAKRATSNAVTAAASSSQVRAQSLLDTTTNHGEQTKRSSLKYSSIWRPGNPNECINLASCGSEQPPDAHNAILPSQGRTALGNLAKTSGACESSAAPVLAYFDLVIPSTNDNHIRNPKELATVVNVAPTTSCPNNPSNSTQPISCYFVM